MRFGQAGERGKTGDHGQDGRTGAAGQPGPAGPAGHVGRDGVRGVRGRGLSLLQALAMFLLIVLIGTVLSWRYEKQQDELRHLVEQTQRQQAEIEANELKIINTQKASCVGGRRILEGFNRQQDRLAEIEAELRDNPDASEAGREAAANRIKAYKDGKIAPLPECPPR